MKKSIFIIIVLVFIFTLVGCSTENEQAMLKEDAKPVKTVEVKEEQVPITLQYIGVIDTQSIDKYSFKSPGKIARVYVEEGQQIKKGDRLAELETKDLNYAVKAAKAQLDAANAQFEEALNGVSPEKLKQAEENVKKAEEAYNFTKSSYDRLLELYNQNNLSQQDLEKAEMEMNLRKSDLEIAKQVELEANKGISDEKKRMLLAQIDQAKANYDQKREMLEDSIIRSDVDGYVLDVLFNKGEMVDAGYPVIAVRNNRAIANVGLTQEDADIVKIGTKVKLKTNAKELEGVVASINSIPDPKTRTYNAEIELTDNSFRIGTIVNVTFYIKEETGILIPITSILKNGETYVYIIEDSYAKRKTVTLGNTKEDLIMVKGLSVGDNLVIDGLKEISDGDKVIIKP